MSKIIDFYNFGDYAIFLNMSTRQNAELIQINIISILDSINVRYRIKNYNYIFNFTSQCGEVKIIFLAEFVCGFLRLT